jgi:hypothetical protein
MSHELIIIHQGSGPGGEAQAHLHYKPSHDLPDRVAFRRLQRANKIIEELLDFLYAPADEADPPDAVES